MYLLNAILFSDINNFFLRTYHSFLFRFEKYHSDDEIRYSVVGYASVYDYYAYPEHIRPRISQVLILPPYQSKGLCMKLLLSVYNHYLAEKSNILDFTGMKVFQCLYYVQFHNHVFNHKKSFCFIKILVFFQKALTIGIIILVFLPLKIHHNKILCSCQCAIFFICTFKYLYKYLNY